MAQETFPLTADEKLATEATALTSVTQDVEEATEPVKVKVKAREVWAKKIDFLFALIGFSVGLGNVWRFPFLCYKNGGGAFLIPYFIAVFLGGIPSFFLEVSLGQFMSEGGIGVWKIAPLFQGIGYASAVIVFILNCEYNIILTWAYYYLFASFTSVLPWSNCDNEWNTETCHVDHRKITNMIGNITNYLNITAVNVNASLVDLGITGLPTALTNETQVHINDPVTEFWERKVLGLSSGIDEPGVVKWDLCLCLLLAWVIVYFCIWKGIRSSGKVMYFTATSPYVFMFILLIRGLTLEGAMDGIKFYLIPDFSRLTDPQVWVDAGTQIFFSYSISLGTLTALGSYNRFNHNSFRDALLFAGVNTFTSLLAGLVIFSILGFMAVRQGVSVADVAESGPGLAFIAYPEAVSQMPVAPLWSALFFTMIILLGLDSQFVGVEGFITFMVDLYPDVFRKGHRREILIGIVCAISFLIGLSMVSQGGMYVFQLFDYYSSSRIVMIVAFFECVVVSYVYGADRFQDNLEMMYGFRVFPLVKWMWKLLTPLFTMSIFALGVITYSEISYERKFVTYEYPKWAIMIGWTLGLCSVINIPIFVVYRLYKQKGSLRNRLRLASKPILKKHQIRVGEDLNKINIVLEEPDESLEANGIMDGETNRNTHSSAISTITTM
ncbi:sodium- and chloride-dependent taurine transporter-like isoform X3 [Dreissena polymorpha]|uniref:sodium- and chloride-dependent taurine transporter-like isoform X2 n=1 Tax=Dreissena polymorpha TaxID=45954 RepID=UPI002264A3E8|nr:sodium- and chloride-dependent taurine transporter-like isoform X2 [Dreissena polymorpha]XP_052279080.1 sodium- and chloride-dependent taurine transporter-like isoform X3 [Dreissena polymorpha]